MTSNPAPGKSSRTNAGGRLAVVLMVLAGCAAGILAVTYWHFVGRYTDAALRGVQQQEGADASASPRDSRSPAAAAAASAPGEAASGEPLEVQLASLRERFNAAAGSGPTRPSLGSVAQQARAIAERFPGSAEAHQLLGLILLQSGEHAESYDALARSLKLDPEQAELHLAAGTMATRLGNFESAREHYLAAVALQPANVRAQLHLGSAQAALGEHDAARKTYLRVIQLDSEVPIAYAGLADLAVMNGDFDEALERIRQAVDLAQNQVILKPDSPTRAHRRDLYVRKWAHLLRLADQPEHALLILSRLPGKTRLQPAVLEETAGALAEAGKAEEAAQTFENAAALDPTNAAYVAGAFRWRLRQGQLSVAERHLARFRDLNPHSPDLPVYERKLAAAHRGESAENAASAAEESRGLPRAWEMEGP